MEILRNLFCSLAIVLVMLAVVNGQDETINVFDDQVNITSPGYVNGSYSPNLNYDILISTNLTNHTLALTVIDCEMEFSIASDKIICVDSFEVYDGSSSSATRLGTKNCCPTGETLPTFESTGDKVYILFSSDSLTEKKGFAMTVKTENEITTTTSTTTTTTTTTTSGRAAASTDDSNDNLGIIVGCVVGGVNLIIIIVIILVCFVKKSDGTSVTNSNRKIWSRASTTVQPFSAKDVSPAVEVPKTNVFDMDLPAADSKANQLPPLKQNLAPGPKENSFVLE